MLGPEEVTPDLVLLPLSITYVSVFPVTEASLAISFLKKLKVPGKKREEKD